MRWNVSLIFLLISPLACTLESPKRHFVRAEWLWSEGNYAAAIIEYDRTIKKSPKSPLGLQALYRSAGLLAVFLNRYEDAIERYQSFIDRSEDAELVWNAKKEMGEILFTHLGRYKRAAEHYQDMITIRPKDANVPLFKFRIAKAEFFLWKFVDARQSFQKLYDENPHNEWGEQALLEIAQSYYTQGEQEPGGYADSHNSDYLLAIKAYEKFLKAFPQSARVPEAKFGIASCYEELDQLAQAVEMYESIRTTYPSPGVVNVRLERLGHRKGVKGAKTAVTKNQ